MIEIRLHGRGGQGTVTAAELLAVSAFDDGQEAQAFPAFGVERRGAPVMAFCRISDKTIRVRTQIYEPDFVIVQDATLMESVNVLAGLKPDGIVLINTEAPAADLKLKTSARVVTFPATQIALEELGRPIMNTAILGAFVGAVGSDQLRGHRAQHSPSLPGRTGREEHQGRRACLRPHEGADANERRQHSAKEAAPGHRRRARALPCATRPARGASCVPSSTGTSAPAATPARPSAPRAAFVTSRRSSTRPTSSTARAAACAPPPARPRRSP